VCVASKKGRHSTLLLRLVLLLLLGWSWIHAAVMQALKALNTACTHCLLGLGSCC
jgi:hypothetical protein